MLTRRNIILVGAAGAWTTVAARAVAADTSAHDFVAAIYKTYAAKHSNGVALDNARTVRRYFEPSLAAAILKDQKESVRRNEVGALDFDPFVDAQDWEIGTLTISVSETGPDKASVTVKFSNFGKPSTVVLDLVKVKNEWKITDITWTPHEKPNNLRALYTH